MKTTKITLILLAFAGLVSCKKGGFFCYKENGALVTETRDVSNFDEIDLSIQGNVFVTQGDHYELQVEASENILEIIKTEVKGKTLVINKKKGKCISGNPTINYYVITPELSELHISGSGDIYADGLINTNKMKMVISGSGNITLDSLETNNLEMHISGSGSMFVDGVDTMDSQSIHISGSGDVTTLNAPVNYCDVDISGSGSATVNVIQSLKVNISGSGDVIYIGTPAVTSKISGSGGVRPY